MNEQYFEKLRNIYSDSSLEEVNQDRVNQMIAIYNQLIRICQIGRLQGLLAIEEAAMTLKDNGFEAYLKKLLLLLVEGTEPEKIEEIGLTYIFSEHYDSFDSLVCLMCLRGILLIQEGESPYMLKNVLKPLLPKECIDSSVSND